MAGSRIPGFYKVSVAERLRLLREEGHLSDEDYRSLASGEHALSPEVADKLVENVIGVFGLPLGLALNFVVNRRPYLVPAVVEEPSIIAAMSAAAKLVAEAGGFAAESMPPLLAGQVQVVDVAHASHARLAILQRKGEILDLANSVHPTLVARGGGALDVEVFIHAAASSSRGDMVVVHLLVDTCDAMGANIVNGMCEGVAPLIESITGGKVCLRILSNLTDRALVRARAEIPVRLLRGKGVSGEDERDGIILASEFAATDPYRAATHNKGIMNGIDAVAIATGNDWRAIEAAAHAYASRGQRYTALSRWSRNEAGDLVGQIEIPLKVGIVGGTLRSNSSVGLAHRLMGIGSARELAELMGAVGLAQNFAALRALATEGIQRGHMALHARSVAVAAGASAENFDTVVRKLIEGGEIKISQARKIIEEQHRLQREDASRDGPSSPGSEGTSRAPSRSSAPARVVLVGEQAVEYGSHAIAAPIPLLVEATVEDHDDGIVTRVPAWGYEHKLRRGVPASGIAQTLEALLQRIDLLDRAMLITLYPEIPRAMGLGASAAIAVALLRALSDRFQLGLSSDAISAHAHECERVVHGMSSGLDNTVVTVGGPILFRSGTPPEARPIRLETPIPIVVGVTGVQSLTVAMNRRIEEALARHRPLYNRIFREIDTLALDAKEAIETHDLPQLGEIMNVAHGLLSAIGLSTWEIEELVQLARAHGALGAKMTGTGGGGAVVALCTESSTGDVAQAMRRAGYEALVTELTPVAAGRAPKDPSLR